MLTDEEIVKMAQEAGFDVETELNEPIALSIEGESCTDEVLKLAHAVYAAGQVAEREECAKACDAISEDSWNLYKGRAPYTGREDDRASPHTEGISDGAARCADAIRLRRG